MSYNICADCITAFVIGSRLENSGRERKRVSVADKLASYQQGAESLATIRELRELRARVEALERALDRGMELLEAFANTDTVTLETLQESQSWREAARKVLEEK